MTLLGIGVFILVCLNSFVLISWREEYKCRNKEITNNFESIQEFVNNTVHDIDEVYELHHTIIDQIKAVHTFYADIDATLHKWHKSLPTDYLLDMYNHERAFANRLRESFKNIEDEK